MTTEQRLARLERENRWMKRLGSLALATAAVVVLVAQGGKKPEVHDVLRAKRFELVGTAQSGKRGKAEHVFGEWGVTSNDTVTLRLSPHPDDALIGATLTATAEMVGLEDGKDQRNIRATLRIGKVGTPGLLVMGGTDHVSGISLGSVTNRGPHVWIRCHEEDGPEIKLTSKDVTRVSISVVDGPSIELKDSKEQNRAVLGVTHTVDKKTGAKTTTAENTLTMYDAKGDVIWQAPR